MRKFKLRILFGSVFALISAAAMACDGSYDPGTHIAQIPCVRSGQDRSYHVVLVGNGGRDFVLTAALEFAIVDPPVTGLRIVGSFPCTAAIVPFVEAVPLFGFSATDPRLFSYSVNGRSIVPTF